MVTQDSGCGSGLRDESIAEVSSDVVQKVSPAVASRLLGERRLRRYIDDAAGDAEAGIALAKANQDLAGTLHSQLGYVELAVRNAIDSQLKTLALAETGIPDWTRQGMVPEDVHLLIHGNLQNARELAQRDLQHSAQGADSRSILHDDVLAHLMWGSWVKLIGSGQTSASTEVQQRLWAQTVHKAFPQLMANERSRIKLSKWLWRIREIRNREAHYDNLLETACCINEVIGTCYAVLNAIDPRFGKGWINATLLRRQAKKMKNLTERR